MTSTNAGGARATKVAASRLWFGQVTLARCPVLRVIRRNDRLIPEDREAWLREVEADV